MRDPVKRERPFGVTVIAGAQVTNAAIAIARIGITEEAIRDFLGHVDYFQLANPVFGVVGLIMAVGLWRLERWSWVGTMLWAGSNMATSLFSYYQGEPHYATMALSVIAVFYLNLREVQITFLGQSLHQEIDRE